MVYAIANQKGGVGKSTTAAALWAGAARFGVAALAVDLDPQCNLSYAARADTRGATVYELLTGEVSAAEAVQRLDGGAMIAASPALAGADKWLDGVGAEYRLREGLEPLLNQYSLIVIDCPPALGILTVNALVACGRCIIPAGADVFSLQGVEQLAGTLGAVRRYCNPALTVDGILLTRYNPRAVLSREAAELAGCLAQSLGSRVYDSRIRDTVAVREAQIAQKSLFDYAPRSTAAADYINFIKEVLKNGEKF